MINKRIGDFVVVDLKLYFGFMPGKIKPTSSFREHSETIVE